MTVPPSRRPALLAVLLLGLLGAPGCWLVGPVPEVEYDSQEAVLEAAARASGFEPRSSWRIVYIEASADFVTFQYRGIEHPGDRAWVIRFAQKSSEQRPDELATLDLLLEAVGEGKEAFSVVERGTREVGAHPVEFARYRYSSSLKDDRGRPVQASGAVAFARVGAGSTPTIYQIDIDNFEGDRTDLGWDDLLPFLQAIPD